MAIRLDGEFQEKFDNLKKEEFDKLDEPADVEVGVYFERSQLASLSFNVKTGPWGDNYWILFPNPEKVEWEDIRQALAAGLKYMTTRGIPGDQLGIVD
ncbi:MAG: hypothetical protein J7M18_08275 [Candidatus Eremiobacteraeota bacterium]|nr:hypothetical protein [Candidatus Eremiobacteraeota bacterium]